MKDIKEKFSIAWVFVMFNYLYADVLTIFDALFTPGSLEELMNRSAGPVQVTQGFLLAAAVLMEISIAMVVLSRVLEYRANRWANIIAGTLATAAVLSTMFLEAPTLYYAFFGIIEVVCTALIVWCAWRWPDPDGQSSEIPILPTLPAPPRPC